MLVSDPSNFRPLSLPNWSMTNYSIPWSIYLQRDGKDRTLADFTLNSDFSAQGADKSLHDGKAEAGAAKSLRGRHIAAIKLLEDLVQFFPFDSNSGVGHDHFQ